MNKRLFLPGFSNFVIAFGGGAVLGKGVGIISTPILPLGSISAFFVGTCLGLLLLFSRFSKLHNYREIFVAVSGIVASAFLLIIYSMAKSSDGLITGHISLLFYVLLCVRFAFWFLTRVYRSDRVGHDSPKAVPTIEGMFHLGTVMSLALIGFGFLNLSFINILILDLVAQSISAAIALISSKPKAKHEGSLAETDTGNSLWSAKPLLASVAVFSISTVLIQVIIFYQAGIFSVIGPLLLAGFYAGLALVGLLGARYGIEFKTGHSLLGHVCIGSMEKGASIPGSVLLGTGLVAVFIIQTTGSSMNFSAFIVSLLGSIAYELYALGVLYKIAKESLRFNVDSAIAKSFGVMACCAATSLLVLQAFKFTNTQIYIVISFLLILIIVSFQISKVPSLPNKQKQQKAL